MLLCAFILIVVSLANDVDSWLSNRLMKSFGGSEPTLQHEEDIDEPVYDDYEYYETNVAETEIGGKSGWGDVGKHGEDLEKKEKEKREKRHKEEAEAETAERLERLDRGMVSERGERAERTEIAERGMRGERGERGERAYRGESAERSEVWDRGQRGARAEEDDREAMKASIELAAQSNPGVLNEKAVEEPEYVDYEGRAADRELDELKAEYEKVARENGDDPYEVAVGSRDLNSDVSELYNSRGEIAVGSMIENDWNLERVDEAYLMDLYHELELYDSPE